MLLDCMGFWANVFCCVCFDISYLYAMVGSDCIQQGEECFSSILRT